MVGEIYVGQHQTLTRKFAKALASAAIVGSLALVAWGLSGAPSSAGGENRTISLYHIHTKERLTVTYMANGRYVPSAMKKINHLMRDWRRQETIVIDPKTIDLMWELHADLGSKAPISIVCGYRSPKTNAFLKRIGRKVAGKSQHTRGKAIDFFFPDVATKKIRNVALAHRLGGVGYYGSAGGPTGFIHADSGNVRQWGPGMRGSQVASYIRDGQKYMGKRQGKKLWSSTQVAAAETGNKKSGGLLGLLIGNKKAAEETVAPVETAADNSAPTPVEAIYGDADEELADLSADAAAAQTASERKKLKAPTPVEEPYGLAAEDDAVANGELAALADSAAFDPAMAEEDSNAGRKLPKPRLKPRAVLALADAKEQENSVHIEPASAPPETQNTVKKPSQVVAALGSLNTPKGAIEGPLEDASLEQTAEGLANPEGKSSLSEGDVIIRPVIAALADPEPSWWSFLAPDVEADLRRDGLPPGAEDMKTDILPVAVELGPDGTGPATSLEVQSEADGKGDAQSVNREGKGNLPTMVLRLSSRGGLENDTTTVQ